MSAVVAPADPPFADVASWSVTVCFRKRPVQSRWVDFEWETATVTVADASCPAPALASGASEVLIDGETRWCYAGQPVELHPSEGEGYWLNLNSPAPCIFVMWRMEEDDQAPRPAVVTLSYNEAGRMLDAGDHVDNVAMPVAMREVLAAYTAAHYKPEPRKKVRRNDPFREGAFRRQASSGSGESRG